MVVDILATLELYFQGFSMEELDRGMSPNGRENSKRGIVSDLD